MGSEAKLLYAEEVLRGRFLVPRPEVVLLSSKFGTTTLSFYDPAIDLPHNLYFDEPVRKVIPVTRYLSVLIKDEPGFTLLNRFLSFGDLKKAQTKVDSKTAYITGISLQTPYVALITLEGKVDVWNANQKVLVTSLKGSSVIPTSFDYVQGRLGIGGKGGFKIWDTTNLPEKPKLFLRGDSSTETILLDTSDDFVLGERNGAYLMSPEQKVLENYEVSSQPQVTFVSNQEGNDYYFLAGVSDKKTRNERVWFLREDEDFEKPFYTRGVSRLVWFPSLSKLLAFGEKSYSFTLEGQSEDLDPKEVYDATLIPYNQEVVKRILKCILMKRFLRLLPKVLVEEVSGFLLHVIPAEPESP